MYFFRHPMFLNNPDGNTYVVTKSEVRVKVTPNASPVDLVRTALKHLAILVYLYNYTTTVFNTPRKEVQ